MSDNTRGETVRLAFVDCETTGVDPERHEMWELAIVTVAPWDDDHEPGEWTWQLPVDLAKADPQGLTVGRFYERRRRLPRLGGGALVRYPASAEHGWDHVPVTDAAQQAADLLDGTHLVGAVPSFDASFIGRWLRANGQAPVWHYHLVDVEALVAGHSGIAPPWDSAVLSESVGVDPGRFERHSALGDARWAQALYLAVLGAHGTP